MCARDSNGGGHGGGSGGGSGHRGSDDDLIHGAAERQPRSTDRPTERRGDDEPRPGQPRDDGECSIEGGLVSLSSSLSVGGSDKGERLQIFASRRAPRCDARRRVGKAAATSGGGGSGGRASERTTASRRAAATTARGKTVAMSMTSATKTERTPHTTRARAPRVVKVGSSSRRAAERRRDRAAATAASHAITTTTRHTTTATTTTTTTIARSRPRHRPSDRRHRCDRALARACRLARVINERSLDSSIDNDNDGGDDTALGCCCSSSRHKDGEQDRADQRERRTKKS